MNILFVTVGTTAIENGGIGKPPDGRDNTALQADMQRYKDDRTKDAGRWRKLQQDLVAAHLKYWEMPKEYTTEKLNFQQSSAELTSTSCLARDLGAEFVMDKIVLLPTDTPAGRMACSVVLEVMKSSQYGMPVARERIVEQPIPGLEKDISKLAEGLRNAIGEQSTSGADRRFVNVTGGFKGTSLMLGRLSKMEFLRIYYQHETLESPVYMHDLRTSGEVDVWRDD